MEFYFSKGSQYIPTLPIKHPARSEGCFIDKTDQGNPCRNKIHHYNFIVFWDENAGFYPR